MQCPEHTIFYEELGECLDVCWTDETINEMCRAVEQGWADGIWMLRTLIQVFTVGGAVRSTSHVQRVFSALSQGLEDEILESSIGR